MTIKPHLPPIQDHDENHVVATFITSEPIAVFTYITTISYIPSVFRSNLNRNYNNSLLAAACYEGILRFYRNNTTYNIQHSRPPIITAIITTTVKYHSRKKLSMPIKEPLHVSNGIEMD